MPGNLCTQRKVHQRALQHCVRQHGAVLSKALCTHSMRATGHHHREDEKSHDNKLACGDHLSSPSLHVSRAAISPLAHRALGAAGAQARLGLFPAV